MSENKEYIKLWMSYKSYFDPLADSELGRLVRAMYNYKLTKKEPKLPGNERFAWPSIMRDIDTTEEAYLAYKELKRKCGSLGGRPKKMDTCDENHMVFSETTETYGIRNKENGQRIMDQGENKKIKNKILISDEYDLLGALGGRHETGH